MVKKNPIFLAICANIIFFFIYLIFGQLKHGSLDDYFMSSVLTGAYGSVYDVHMYFVNSVYGYFLKPFYILFPKVGWYFIFELVGTFSSFIIFTYFLIRRMGNVWGTALSALLLAALTPDFYFQLSFTQCATIYTAAGLLLAYFGISEQEKRFLVLSGCFLIAGSVMRYEGFLLGLPYLILLLLPLMRIQRYFAIKAIALFAFFFLAIFTLHSYDKTLYEEGDYKYYAEYQPIRAYFGDGAFYDREATYDELEERGFSGPDFNLLKSWMFYDTEVFHKDSLLPIKDVAQNNLYEPNLKRLPIAFFLAVSNALTRGNGWCWATLCFLLLLAKTKRGAIYPWFSLGIVALSIGYLLLVNRLAYHVVSGIWLYAIVLSIPFQDSVIFNKEQISLKWKVVMLGGILLAAFALGFNEVSTQQRSNEDTTSSNNKCSKTHSWMEFAQYAKNHPNHVFLLSFERYKELGSVRNPAYLAIEPGAFDNIFSWGYWNIHLPAMKAELAKRGVENPIRDIVHNNVYLMEDMNKASLIDFYKEHYNESLRVDTAKSFGDLMLLKYRLTYKKKENNNE